MRKEGWPEALHDFIAAARKKEFAYGAWDCCLFAADWALDATGVDYAAELRGYSSMKDAYEILARYGSMEAMVTQLLGASPGHPAFAQRGDIVLIKDHPSLGGAPEGLGICLGLNSAFPRDAGLIMIRTLETAAMWMIR